MRVLCFLFLLSIIILISCHQPPSQKSKVDSIYSIGNGLLLTTRIKSLDELKQIIQIEYSKDSASWVQLTQSNSNNEITSILKPGIDEKDILKTRDGSFFDKISLSFRSPYFVMQRKDLMRVYILSRRRYEKFGWPDIAFYDIAETMMNNISKVDLPSLRPEDFSEKGYINTFNHVNAQAFMTSIYSEELADFIADIHERTNMPELISGKFTKEQLADLKTGPVDNYIDIINNEWGQELGKLLSKKYNINNETFWTPELLTNYLNDLQSYYSWVFQFGFIPFKESDELIIKFSNKINLVKIDISGVR